MKYLIDPLIYQIHLKRKFDNISAIAHITNLFTVNSKGDQGGDSFPCAVFTPFLTINMINIHYRDRFNDKGLKSKFHYLHSGEI